MIGKRKSSQINLRELFLAGCLSSDLEQVKACLTLAAPLGLDIINSADEERLQSGLHMALLNTNKEMVKFLLSEENVDINKEDVLGRTPLDVALEVGSVETISMICQVPRCSPDDQTLDRLIEVTERDGQGKTPLMHLLESGKREVIRQYCARNYVNLDRLEESWTEAFGTKEKGKMRLLLSLGVEINLVREGQSALICAVKKQSLVMVDFLLKQPGVDVNITDREDNTALSVACGLDDLKIIKRILQVPGLDIHHRNRQGETAVYLAMTVSHRKMAKIKLLKEFADWNQECRRGELTSDTPLTLAVARGLDHILQFLLAQPGILIPARLTHLAVANETEGKPRQCLQILCEDPRVNWSSRNTAGDTAVMIAIESRKFSKLKILLDTEGVECDQPTRELGLQCLKDLLGNLSILCNIPGLEQAATSLLKEKFVPRLGEGKGSGGRSGNVPDCPVCFHRFSKRRQVFQCVQGHFVCGACYPKLEICPICRENMLGRAHGYEGTLGQ